MEVNTCPHCEMETKDKKGIKLSTIALVVLFLILIVLLLGPVILGWNTMDYAILKAREISNNAIEYTLVALPWILLGFILGGFAIEFIPRKWFVRELGGTGPKTVLKAGLAGLFVDVCSHGALAVGMSMYKSGASFASTVTFLLATPWLGFMETMILLGLLGFKVTVAMIFTSFIAAITTGIIIGKLEERHMIETHRKVKVSKTKFNLWKAVKKSVSNFKWKTFPNRTKLALKESWSLFNMIATWLFIGFVAAGLVLTFIQPETIQSLMGYASNTALPFTALLASVIEVCSEGTVPLAAAFKNMGASIGALFVFLMAGVASDVTELGAISDVIGKRAAAATFIVAVSVTIILGYILNWVWLGFNL